MKRLISLLGLGLIVSLSLPVWSVFAQSPAKSSLPQVPITYAGDTADTIKRRAQWVEGAKKEGSLDWWGILMPAESRGVIAEFKGMNRQFFGIQDWTAEEHQWIVKPVV